MMLLKPSALVRKINQMKDSPIKWVRENLSKHWEVLKWLIEVLVFDRAQWR